MKKTDKKKEFLHKNSANTRALPPQVFAFCKRQRRQCSSQSEISAAFYDFDKEFSKLSRAFFANKAIRLFILLSGLFII